MGDLVGQKLGNYHLTRSPVVTPVSLPPTQYAVSSKPAGTVISTFRKHSERVNAVAWSSDGRYIASGDISGKIQVWNSADGELIYTYPGHSGSVRTVAWSPDGKYIASGGGDTMVQVWVAPH
jgi:WD40 repeat protein